MMGCSAGTEGGASDNTGCVVVAEEVAEARVEAAPVAAAVAAVALLALLLISAMASAAEEDSVGGAGGAEKFTPTSSKIPSLNIECNCNLISRVYFITWYSVVLVLFLWWRV
jgi:hypothetical protein